VVNFLDNPTMRRLALGFLFIWFAVGTPVMRSQVPRADTPSVRSAYGQKLRVLGIPNAGKITDQLYRGAQPRAGGLEQLKTFGITTIVDLRGEDSNVRNLEKKEAEALGIHFVSIPVSGWSAPSIDQVAQFLSLFGKDSTERVFVHCRLGEDRTGVFVAIYRMAAQKWTAEQAIKEMYFFGFNGFWHRAMVSFVREFPALVSSSPTLATWSNSKSSVTAVFQPN
jgi:tyrosine-protein phosphatase SIW14